MISPTLKDHCMMERDYGSGLLEKAIKQYIKKDDDGCANSKSAILSEMIARS